jgi:dynein heavy chain
VSAGIPTLIRLLPKAKSPHERLKLRSLVASELRARDVLSRLIADSASSATAFAWQAQLRYSCTDGASRVAVADAIFVHGYEYSGVGERLVLTPQSDRCFVTLTQALSLAMGGACAGAAGAGKTETIRELGTSLGRWLVVIGCSAQLTKDALGGVLRGLAMSGAWGCLDAMDRLSPGSLSVLATQLGAVLAAVRAKTDWFTFEGERVSLRPTVGVMATTSAGYAGRHELPMSLTGLFRPCAVVAPDLQVRVNGGRGGGGGGGGGRPGLFQIAANVAHGLSRPCAVVAPDL